MEISEETRDAVKIIGLRGRLDAVTSPVVEKQLLALASQGVPRIALDFSGLVYISSIGLRILMTVAKQVQTGGGRLAIAALNDNVHEIFRLAGLTELFSLYPTLDEAAAYCAR